MDRDSKVTLVALVVGIIFGAIATIILKVLKGTL